MNWKRISASLATVLLTSLVGCVHHYVYQNTTWGMSERALKSARPASQAAAAAPGEKLWSEHTVIDALKLKVTVTYKLGAKGLKNVTVVFDPVQVDKPLYIDYYHQVKALLSEKYGPPEAESADLAVRSQKYRITATPDYQTKCVFRTPDELIELTCGGECDGSAAANAITISYDTPQARTEGL
jgi:hypothetical protein